MRPLLQHITLIICCAAIFSAPMAHAQEMRPFAISCEPLYILNYGVRINLERKITQRDWAGINITGYSAPDSHTYGSWMSNSDFYRIDAMKGIGIGGTYKRHFFRKLFINLGAGYTFFDVQKKDFAFEEFHEDGMLFYQYDKIEKHCFFNKITTNASIGIHSTFQQLFFVEPYLGAGLAYSFYDQSYRRKYNETMFGFGYRGFYWVLGVKLGFNIPRSR